ncbi:MAG: DUF1097 domain-containing protein [Tissierellales bacterium]|jgi:hypothetical protein|nr:DUF1097 domain-containing protein [Tissierellales bacterium]
MNLLLSLGISIGVLAGIWTAMSVVLGWSTWCGFAAWATFYAAGGKEEGLKKAIFSNLSGVFWGVVIVQISNLLTPMIGGTVALSIGVVVGAFAMCLQANISLLAFIPGAFIGAAIYFGSGDVVTAVVGLVSGGLFGYVSEKGSNLLMGKKSEEASE